MSETHQPLLAFDTDDPEFVRGFEVGRLWTMLRTEPDQEVKGYVRADNVEMVLRLAEATGRSVRSVDLNDSWLYVYFDAVSTRDLAPS